MVAITSRRLRTPVLSKIDLRWSCTVFVRDPQLGRDLGGRVSLAHQLGHGAFALRQAVGLHDHLGHLVRRRGLDDDRDLAAPPRGPSSQEACSTAQRPAKVRTRSRGTTVVRLRVGPSARRNSAGGRADLSRDRSRRSGVVSELGEPGLRGCRGRHQLPRPVEDDQAGRVDARGVGDSGHQQPGSQALGQVRREPLTSCRSSSVKACPSRGAGTSAPSTRLRSGAPPAARRRAPAAGTDRESGRSTRDHRRSREPGS